MQPTTDRPARWRLWVPLLGIAMWLALTDDEASAPAAASAATRVPARATALHPLRSTAVPPPPGEGWELAARAELVTPASRAPSRDLFANRSWSVLPAPVPASDVAPVAPPVPFAFLGKKFDGEAWEVYLSRGEQTFVAVPGSQIEGIYRVDSIEPPLLMLTYLPLALQQTLLIGEPQ